MSWSAEQREWLQALGYDVLALAPSADARNLPVEGRASHAPSVAPVAGDLEPLLRALLHATRTDAHDEVRTIAGDLARLRADPAAKRAAWPRLRALRVRRRP